jgi:hypothetical protein
MRKLAMTSAFLLSLGIAPALADTNITISPTVDAWVTQQSDSGATYEGDLVVGTEMPGTVTYVDVPDSPDVAFVYVNKKRVLVDKKSRKVVKIYD